MKRKRKAASSDFTAAMLPQSRKEIFYDVLKLQWRKLLLLGVITALFSLPLLVSTLVGDVYAGNLLAAVKDSEPELEAAAAGALFRFELLRGAVNIPLFLLFLVGLSGTLRVLRQLAWEENVHLPTDFAAGLRSNLGQLTALGLLCSVTALLCKNLLYLFSAYNSAIVATVSLLPVAVSVLILLPAACLCLVMIPIYANSLKADLKNAFYVFFSAPWRVLATLAVCALFWLPSLLPRLYFRIFGHLFAYLMLPLTLLGWTLFCYDKFDMYINAEQCPELIGKGIFHPEEQTAADDIEEA